MEVYLQRNMPINPGSAHTLTQTFAGGLHLTWKFHIGRNGIIVDWPTVVVIYYMCSVRATAQTRIIRRTYLTAKVHCKAIEIFNNILYYLLVTLQVIAKGSSRVSTVHRIKRVWFSKKQYYYRRNKWTVVRKYII